MPMSNRLVNSVAQRIHPPAHVVAERPPQYRYCGLLYWVLLTASQIDVPAPISNRASRHQYDRRPDPKPPSYGVILSRRGITSRQRRKKYAARHVA